MYTTEKATQQVENVRNNIIREIQDRLNQTPDKEIKINGLTIITEQAEGIKIPLEIRILTHDFIIIDSWVEDEGDNPEIPYSKWSLDELFKILQHLENHS